MNAPSMKLKAQDANAFWDRVEAEGGRPMTNQFNELQNAIIQECSNAYLAPTDSGQVRKNNLRRIEALSKKLNVTVTIPNQWNDRDGLQDAILFPNSCINKHLFNADHEAENSGWDYDDERYRSEQQAAYSDGQL